MHRHAIHDMCRVKLEVTARMPSIHIGQTESSRKISASQREKINLTPSIPASTNASEKTRIMDRSSLFGDG
jgi:hypothetical protein